MFLARTFKIFIRDRSHKPFKRWYWSRKAISEYFVIAFLAPVIKKHKVLSSKCFNSSWNSQQTFQ